MRGRPSGTRLIACAMGASRRYSSGGREQLLCLIFQVTPAPPQHADEEDECQEGAETPEGIDDEVALAVEAFDRDEIGRDREE